MATGLPDDALDEVVTLVAAQRIRHSRLDRMPQVLVGAAVALTVLLYGGQHLLARYPLAETERQRPVYRPPFPLDRARLARLPLERALAELLPDLTLTAAHVSAGRAQPASLERAGARLAEAVAGDPNLAQLVAELRTGLTAPPGSRARLALPDTVAALSGYLDAGGQPFHAEAFFLDGGRRRTPPPFHVTTYRVVTPLGVRVTGERYRARLLRRLDRTTVTELYLGHAESGRTGALVVLDRIVDYALQDLLPRMASGSRSPLATAALAEVQAALGPAAITALGALARRDPAPASFRALDALSLFLARITLSHEVRHLADQRQQRGLERPLPCPGCPAALGVRNRAELSAYLASMAVPGQGATALLQVCDTLSHSRAHGAVLELIGREVARCQGPFPDGPDGLSAAVSARARAAERRLFGRSDPIELPALLSPES
jgi:hypothetical protein